MNIQLSPRQSYSEKLLLPEKLLKLIHAGEVTYVEFEEFIYFHFTVIKVLEMLRKKGKPLVVHIRSIDNKIFSLETVRSTLCQFEAVDFVVNDKNGEFTLMNREEALFSNTYFLGKDINAYSEELIDRRRSYYHTSLKHVSLNASKYLHPDTIHQQIQEYRRLGEKVALVTGVFDVLHPGHVTFLEKARKNADVLIVLVNSDLSANHQPKNRDHDRPVHRLHERVCVLNALSSVTHIIPFDSDTALPILHELTSDIVYVKTAKDKERRSIQREVAVVKERGGKAVFIPSLRNKSGSIISSTMLIRACRKKADGMPLDLNESWSFLAKEHLTQLLAEIKKWDTKTSQISRLKAMLRERYDGSLTTAIGIEKEVITQISILAEEMYHSLPQTRTYYAYFIPYLIGKILDFPIRIVPVQYRRPGLPYGMLNSVQRLGGKTVFFDSLRKEMFKPIRFEEYFWKAMPHHTHYMGRLDRRVFAERIYVYEKKIHQLSLSIKILQEELTYLDESKVMLARYREEIKELMKQIWEMFEMRSFDNAIDADDFILLPHKEPRLPGIVAHGGAALLSPKDPHAENSASGIRHALKMGIDLVEIDICVCKDGWVVSHDLQLEIGTTSSGLIIDKTEAELQQVRLKNADGSKSEERLITLAEALQIVREERDGDHRPTYCKIDIKLSEESQEKKLIDTIKNCGMPLGKILITSQLTETNGRLRTLCPKLPMECNTVETNLYLLAYQLMNDEFMVGLYLGYIIYFARETHSRTVSLAQFAIYEWGEDFSHMLISALHQAGFFVQVWVASTIEEYYLDAKLNADYVLMQDPGLISRVLTLKKDHNALDKVRAKSGTSPFTLHAETKE